ncbi:phytol kinase [Prochlorococcus sp. MIT 0601]|nr:phytol kinase [Prochlorococcus sp. MIT 0601]
MAWWLNISSEVAILFSSLITISLWINYQINWIKTFENIQRKTYGTISYGLSITILLFLFWSNNPPAVCAGVLVMAFGDGLAGLIGKQYNSPVWTIFQQKKSLIGTLTMALVSIFVLLIINTFAASNIQPLQIIAMGLIACCLEQIGPYGIDNLTVPLGVAFLWAWIT